MVPLLALSNHAEIIKCIPNPQGVCVKIHIVFDSVTVPSYIIIFHFKSLSKYSTYIHQNLNETMVKIYIRKLCNVGYPFSFLQKSKKGRIFPLTISQILAAIYNFS